MSIVILIGKWSWGMHDRYVFLEGNHTSVCVCVCKNSTDQPYLFIEASEEKRTEKEIMRKYDLKNFWRRAATLGQTEIIIHSSTPSRRIKFFIVYVQNNSHFSSYPFKYVTQSNVFPARIQLNIFHGGIFCWMSRYVI